MNADEGTPLVTGDDREPWLVEEIGHWIAEGLVPDEVMRLALETNRLSCDPPLGHRLVQRRVERILRRDRDQSRTIGRRMYGLKYWRVDTEWLLGLGHLPNALFGDVFRVFLLSWHHDGLPVDDTALAQLFGGPVSAELHRLAHQFFPIASDGRRRNPKQELDRERLLICCAVRRHAGTVGGQASASKRDASNR